MAVGTSDFNETEDFEEYNPHPYQGGYDIALTYGNPLPPFSAICYPMSESSFYPSLPTEVTLSSIPEEIAASPEAGERAISTSVGREDDLPEAEYGSPDSYGEWGSTSVDWWWNLSGMSPFTMNGIDGWGHDAEEMRYWRPLRRAADFIFGYSQGFGERRIGVDSYGIPIYAYKRHGSDAVDVEIQPARIEKLEHHDDSERWTLACNNWENENYRLDSSAHAYLQHRPEEPFDAKVDPVESLFSWKPTHDGRYDEQLYPERQWVPLSYDERRNEVNLNRAIEIVYDKHYYTGAQNVQLEPVECHKLTYLEASQEFSYPDSNWEPSYSIHGNEGDSFINAYHDYERWDYEQPSDIELEPYKPTWTQYPAYYGISEEDVYSGSQPVSGYSEVYNDSSSPRFAWQASSFGEWDNEGNFQSLECASETYHDAHSFDLEPYKPTWMLNPNYYGFYEDMSASHKQDDDGFYGSDW